MGTNLPPLPEPTIQDAPYELWGQNVAGDFFTEEQMRAYGQACVQERDAVIAALKDDIAAHAAAIYENLSLLADARDEIAALKAAQPTSSNCTKP